MHNATLRNGFAAIALIAVAACSAAGGQNTSTVPAAGMGQASQAAARTPDRRRHHKPDKKKQRNLASAALSIAGAGIELDQFGTSGGLLSGLLHFGQNVAHHRGRSPHDGGTCQNGVEYTWSSTGFGEVSQTIEFFYDTACTMPYNLVTLNATFSQAGGQATGTQETWDENGNVVGYQTYTATFTVGVNGGIGQIVVQKTAGTGPSARPTSQSGFTCLFNTGNAVDCGSGVLTTLPSEQIGFEQTIVGQFVTPSPGPSASPSTEPSASPSGEPSGSPSASPSPSSSPWVAEWHHGPPGGGWQGGGPSGLQLQINGSGYTGAAGALTLAPGTPPAWTIGGGTLIDTLAGTATIGFGGYHHGHGGWHGHWRHGSPGPGAMTSIELTLVDTADGLTVALTSGGFDKLTGAVTETSTGQSVATMSLDYSGTGTITYSNGTVDQVQNWIIVTT